MKKERRAELEAQEKAAGVKNVHPNVLNQMTVQNGFIARCPDCHHIVWTSKLVVKQLPAAKSPTGEVHQVPIPIIVCDNCGERLDGQGKWADDTGAIVHHDPKKVAGTILQH